MGRLVDLTGKKFGRLTVQSYAGLDGGKNASWHCLCDCGMACIVRGARMREGVTASCGCLITSPAARVGIVRGDGSLGKGDAHRATYSTWTSMRARCMSPDHPSYFRYGGRGITVCLRWMESFDNFLMDMGIRPFPGAELDRQDNDGPYSPDNCHWTTTKVNSQNRSNARVIDTPMGQMPVWKAIEVSGINRSCLQGRVHNKWPAARLFDKPRKSPTSKWEG